MSKKANYNGALTLSQINKPVVTPIDDNYNCPVGHTEYDLECPSCRTIYGYHGQKRRTHNGNR